MRGAALGLVGFMTLGPVGLLAATAWYLSWARGRFAAEQAERRDRAVELSRSVMAKGLSRREGLASASGVRYENGGLTFGAGAGPTAPVLREIGEDPGEREIAVDMENVADEEIEDDGTN